MCPVSSRDGERIGAMNALATGPQTDMIGRVDAPPWMTSIVNRGGSLGGDTVSAAQTSSLMRK
jgi:hypothetical protein